mmetsp:Transcript_31147/g.52077  ORF Transcript_31147/g.52077 Transcript_31147/m.52077 type:complete len:205 (-) Transcript_31147:147-761(-)
MDPAADFRQCLQSLIEIFRLEQREGGYEVVEELTKAAATCDCINLPLSPSNFPLMHVFNEEINENDHPILPIVKRLAPYLPWVYSELGGRIVQSLSSGMIQVELIGPDGVIKTPRVRVGLWMQSAGMDYTTHHHAAEETFYIIAGRAHWSTYDAGETVLHGVGEFVHHPSMTPHASLTDPDSILFAVWRWSGDLSIEQYTLVNR